MNVEINFTYLNMGLPLCLVCNLGAIRGRFRRVFGRTKNSPKTATNCAQITNRTQIQPHVKVSEVYFYIHSFILVFSRTKVNFPYKVL